MESDMKDRIISQAEMDARRMKVGLAVYADMTRRLLWYMNPPTAAPVPAESPAKK